MADSSTDLAEDSDDPDGEPTLVLAIDTGTTELRQVIERHRFTTATPIDPAGERLVVDALATPDLLDALGIEPGRAVQARIGGLRLQLRIVSATDVVPFASAEPLALLADHATLVAADYLVTGTSPQPDRWALETAETSRDAVTSALIAPPLASTALEDRWSAAELRTRDPVLVGLTGSLLMAIAAVVTVASVGLVMTAVTGARERRTSHAVLRALGTSRHDLRRWLIRETVPLGVLAITLGATTGLLIATLVLDSLTGDRDGTPAIPPPQLVVPITAIVALMAGALVAIALLPIAMGRLLRGVRPAEELRIGDQL
jgi:predicted lysophospholipase L1 biosynthesis ABC-type transport system permease subunit